MQVWQTKQKKCMYDFPVNDCTQEQTVAHIFLPLFNSKDGCLCQERFLRSRNLAAMVTWRHKSLYRRMGQSDFFLIRHRSKSGTSLEQTPAVDSLLSLSHFLKIFPTRKPPRRSSVAFCESLEDGHIPVSWSILRTYNFTVITCVRSSKRIK